MPSWRGARSSSAKAKGSPKASSRSYEKRVEAWMVRTRPSEAHER
jgi:hypothetical protein